jgi:hypothetical protein
MTEEVIYISSDDAHDDSGAWDERGVIHSLEQTHVHIPGRQRLSVIEGSLVRVERQGVKDRQRFYIRPGYLDPEPQRETHWPKWQAVVAAAALLLGVLLVGLKAFGYVGTHLQLAVMLGAVGLVGVAAAWLGWRDYGHSLTFVTLHGRVPLFRVMEGRPDAAQFAAFLDAVGRATEQGRNALPEARGLFLVEELKEHRRLARIGALEQASYETAKARILRAHGAGGQDATPGDEASAVRPS